MSKKFVYTLESMKQVLLDMGSSLVSDPGTYLVGARVRYICSVPDCNKIGELQFGYLRSTDARCNDCRRADVVAIRSKKRKAESELKKNNKTIPCTETDCKTYVRFPNELKTHLAVEHKKGIEWVLCELVDVKTNQICQKKCPGTSALKQHHRQVHKTNGQKFKCTYVKSDGTVCDKHFPTNGGLTQHMITHNDTRTEVCLELKSDGSVCNTKFKRSGDLQQHKKDVHMLGEIKMLKCDYLVNGKECGEERKSVKTLNSHKAFVHGVNTKSFPCDFPGCTATPFKILSHLKRHKSSEHDMGDYECQCCSRRCYKLTTWNDPKTSKVMEICRTCFHKVTGYKSRIEKEIVDFLKEHFDHPIVVQDKQIRGAACLKYRPDIMYTCGLKNVVIYIEIDEHEHPYNSSNYSCDERRMSDIYDETPGAIVIFIRINPHKYVVPSGVKVITDKNERFHLLLKLLKYVCENACKSDKPLSVYYLCYSPDNELISKNIPHTLVYSENDF